MALASLDSVHLNVNEPHGFGEEKKRVAMLYSSVCVIWPNQFKKQME